MVKTQHFLLFNGFKMSSEKNETNKPKKSASEDDCNQMCDICGGSCAIDGYCKNPNFRYAHKVPDLTAKIPLFYRPTVSKNGESAGAKVLCEKKPSDNQESAGAEVIDGNQQSHNQESAGAEVSILMCDNELAICTHCGSLFAIDSECKNC